MMVIGKERERWGVEEGVADVKGVVGRVLTIDNDLKKSDALLHHR